MRPHWQTARPYIETDAPYAALLEQAGWQVGDLIDITEDFVAAAGELLMPNRSTRRNFANFWARWKPPPK